MRITPLAIAAVLAAADASTVRGERSDAAGGRNLRSTNKGADRKQQRKQQRRNRHLQDACPFCPDGVADPELTLPGPEEATCGQAAAYAATLSADDEFCPTVRIGETLCCPPGIETTQSVLFNEEDSEECAFCVGGIPDVYVKLPGDGDTPTCSQAASMAASLTKDDEICPMVQEGEAVCCPSSAAEEPEATLAEVEEAVLEAEEDPETEEAEPFEACPFCPGGLDDPSLLLPGDGAPSCGEAAGFAASLPASDPLCPAVGQGRLVCCPDDVGDVYVPAIGIGPEVPEEEEETGEEETGTGATESGAGLSITTEAAPEDDGGSSSGPELCSCSPLKYDVVLDLSRDCSTDDLDGVPGVGLTFCFLAEASLGSDDRRLLGKSGKRSFLRELHDGANKRKLQPQQFDAMDPASITVVSVQFLEFDTSGELIVINQDDTYADVELSDGDSLTFDSISANLVPGVAAGDQLDYLPGGVQITMRGKVGTADGQEVVVSNRLTWSYTNECDDVPVVGSDEGIGWMTIVSFCLIFLYAGVLPLFEDF